MIIDGGNASTEFDELADATVLAAYVDPSGNGRDAAFIEECFAQAKAMVDNLIGTATVPTVVVSRAYLEAGSELFHRRQAPNGITQFATPDGSGAIRVARDPMVGVTPILAPFLGGGFA